MWGLQHIQSQAEHNRKMTFQEEFLALLKKHGISVAAGNFLQVYDPHENLTQSKCLK